MKREIGRDFRARGAKIESPPPALLWLSAFLMVGIIAFAGMPFQLTTHNADDIEPSWSPDGKHVVFLSNRINPDDGYDLFIVNVDGTNEHCIARFTVTDPWGGRFSNPSWLGTTGDLLVIDHKYYWEVLRFRFSEVRDLPVERDVWDGDSPYFTQLLFVPGGQGASSAVTFGDKLLVWAALIDYWNLVPPENRRWEVRLYNGYLNTFIGNTDSVGQVIFRTEPAGLIEGPGSVAFSPDGTKVCISTAVRDWTRGKGRDLYVIDLITGETRRLTWTGEEGADNANVAWSSKNLIAFSSGPHGDGQGDLYLIRPDGTDLKRLTNTPWNEEMPAWSPDGELLAFASNEKGNFDICIRSGEKAGRR